MFISEIEEKINSILPLSSGEVSWDNIGVIIDSGSFSTKILLTIDISDSVIDECITKDIKHIISYHPPIFKNIKKITKTDCLIKIIKNDINVFSPHTSWDEHMNNYIFNIFQGMSFEQIINKLKSDYGFTHIRVANACKGRKDIVVGVGSAFKYHNIKNSLIITGEMTHHCILHSIEHNNTVILLEHSNSERLALAYMRNKIKDVLPECTIFISENDVDPIKTF